MILTPISPEQLEPALDRFAARLDDPAARAAFGRIRATSAERACGGEAERHPAHRPIDLVSPDALFEARHWRA